MSTDSSSSDRPPQGISSIGVVVLPECIASKQAPYLPPILQHSLAASSVEPDQGIFLHEFESHTVEFSVVMERSV